MRMEMNLMKRKTKMSNEYEDTDDEDLELFPFFDCIGCKAIFREKGELVRHIRTCYNL